MIDYNGNDVEINSEFSLKDFTGKSLKYRQITGNVYGSCFSREKPDSDVFPSNMQGVTFYDCNLDNCLIPAGNIVVGGSIRRYQSQNDGNDWLVDENNNPTMPTNFDAFSQLGLPIPLPSDIPVAMAPDRIDLLLAAKIAAGMI